ncbi:MAG: YkgJ family cysteine cluster protein [Desulfobacteraceae bacterium]|nr:YkgJ family cysteine cluster protein [Desulfobacteraceae bacterium]
MPSEINPETLFFQCTQCGVCCKGFGGTYVSEADLLAIANYIKRPVEEVRRHCCTLSGNRFVLGQRSDGYCVFWECNCTIHPVKPLMCRRWPFIPSLLVDISNWAIMADNCPGIKAEADYGQLRAYVNAQLKQ